MVKLLPHLIPDWPKLAWVAKWRKSADEIIVYHGPCVEINEQWCVEAVWTGKFSEGDFDQTEIVFGTGIRCRDDHVVFVSAGTMMDRLWHCEYQGKYYVGNSLPAVLACSSLSLLEDYLNYPKDIGTMPLGLNKYLDNIPADAGVLNIAHYHNLIYDGRDIRKIDKVDTTPNFGCYEDYHNYLMDTARRLQVNYQAPERKNKVFPLSTVSAGYDSCAAAKIARDAGCREAVTITNATSLFPRSDSGIKVAQHLGINCREYNHLQRAYRHELSVWAAAGEPAGLNLTIFDYPKPLCLFFTGYRGDSLWRKEKMDRSEPFAVNTITGLGMCEYRLIEGVFHCPVPFWGSRKSEQIQDITFSQEMAPWTLHNDYDRPIPRRMLEQAGIPRELFGNRKEATTVERTFFWPFLPKSRASFMQYLNSRDLYAPSNGTLWILRKLAHLDQLFTVNLNHAFGWRLKGLRPLFQLQGQSLLFHWANAKLKNNYQDALNKSIHKDAQ